MLTFMVMIQRISRSMNKGFTMSELENVTVNLRTFLEQMGTST